MKAAFFFFVFQFVECQEDINCISSDPVLYIRKFRLLIDPVNILFQLSLQNSDRQCYLYDISNLGDLYVFQGGNLLISGVSLVWKILSWQRKHQSKKRFHILPSTPSALIPAKLSCGSLSYRIIISSYRIIIFSTIEFYHPFYNYVWGNYSISSVTMLTHIHWRVITF